MTDREKHIAYLFTAELQFRLASAVNLATALKVQPLDLPMEWTHGSQKVHYEEIALRWDQADFASHFLQNSATYLMAVAIKDAIRVVHHDPKNSKDSDIRGAYQISRLIRNAFAHAPFSPIWSIDKDCRNKLFEVRDVIKLDTTGLEGKPFEWQHYGGPLALFRLCRFVRFEILKDPAPPRRSIPSPKNYIHQVGDLILKRVDKISDDAKRIEPKRLDDGSIDLGSGYFLRAEKK